MFWKALFTKLIQYHHTNLVLWLALFIASMATGLAASTIAPEESNHYITTMVVSLVPLMYVTAVALHPLVQRCRCMKRLDSFASSLPHPLLHSAEYQTGLAMDAKLCQLTLR